MIFARSFHDTSLNALIPKKYINGNVINVPYGTPSVVPSRPFVTAAAITVHPNPVHPCTKNPMICIKPTHINFVSKIIIFFLFFSFCIVYL